MNQNNIAEAQATLSARYTFFDSAFRSLTWLSALVTFSIVIGVLITLVIGAWPALEKFGPGFITSTSWNPVTEEFGALPSVFGTLVTSFIALLLAVPVSFGIGMP